MIGVLLLLAFFVSIIRMASPSFSESDRKGLADALKEALKDDDRRSLLLIIRACGEGNVWELAPNIAQLSKMGSLPIRLEIEIALRQFEYSRRQLMEKANE